MHAVILAIGDELTLGQTLDTNSPWLSARLAPLGVSTRRRVTLPDDPERISEAMGRAAEDSDLIIATGGLGPTEDDMTREALARAMDAPLEMHPPSLERIEAFFHRRGREMPERNRRQAMRPSGADVLVNESGTAPGLRAELGQAEVFLLPGVPAEMRAMFDQHIVPTIANRPSASDPGSPVLLTATLHTYGEGESAIADRLGEMLCRDRNPTLGTSVSRGIVSIRVRSRFATADQARARLDQALNMIQQRLGSLIFGRDDTTLEQNVGELLTTTGRTVTVAESCTGGLIATRLTDAPGTSSFFSRGWITYANDVKHEQLGVPMELLREHGAVSEPVARAMAQGARRLASTDHALSVTGVAGPSGGSEQKPVGTVWIALASDAGGSPHTITHHFLFPGDRAMIRTRAANAALNLLRLHLLGDYAASEIEPQH